MAMETLSCSPTNSAKTAPYRRRSPLSWPGDYRECSSYLNQAHEILLNEMESDAAKKAAFAVGLGARQAEITRVLSDPA